MTVGDVYRATLDQAFDDTGIVVNNVVWFEQRVASGSQEVDERELGEGLSAWWQAHVRNWTSNQFRLHAVHVQRMYPVLGAPVTTPAIRQGQWAAFPPLPAVLAAVLQVRAATGGRRGRGRLYLTGFPTHGANGISVLASSGSWRIDGFEFGQVLAGFAALRDTYPDALQPVNLFTWGVWSKRDAGPTPPFAYGFRTNLSLSTDGVIRVQRRREFGVSLQGP